MALAGQATLLEALQAGIAATLAVLDDPGATGTGRSSMELLGVPGGILAQTLAGYLVREIVVRGAQGGPLADQLNHDVTHLQGQRLEGMLAQVVSLVMPAALTCGNPAASSAVAAIAKGICVLARPGCRTRPCGSPGRE